jgi:hypothetical protein
LLAGAEKSTDILTGEGCLVFDVDILVFSVPFNGGL